MSGDQQSNVDQSLTTRVRNISGVRYVYQGVHARYVFDHMQVLDVAKEDVPDLLSKKSRGGGCCGSGSSEHPYFEIVED